MRRLRVLLVLSSLALASTHAPPSAAAQTATTTLRLSFTMPRGSAWESVARAWNRSLGESSNGALALDLTVGSAAGPESGLAGAIAAGTIDVAMVTSLGIASAVPAARVLDAPGALDGATELDAARAAVRADLDALLTAQDLVMLGWLDFGDARIFSTAPIATPSDLSGRRTWLHPGDTVVDALLDAAGGTSVTAPLDQVLLGLGAGTLDTVVASALAVTGMTWSTHLTHVTDRPLFHLGGMTVMRRSTYLALSDAARAALDSTSATVHTRLGATIRRDESRSYTALTTDRLTVVDTTASAAAWDTACRTARTALVGSQYTRALLRTVEAAGD